MRLTSFWLAIMLLLGPVAQGQAQVSETRREWGFTIGADFNRLARPDDQFPLVNERFSNLTVGLHYRAYNRRGGITAGLNLLLKNPPGGAALPLVMEDFGPNDAQETALSAAEAYFQVGPRFGWVHPFLGASAGWRPHAVGWRTADSSSYNRLFLGLPLGVTLMLPTGFGSVGLTVQHTIGLSNVLARPANEAAGWDGGTLRSWRITLHAALQKR